MTKAAGQSASQGPTFKGPRVEIFLPKKGKIQNFAINVVNMRISPGFLLIQKENGNSNMFCKFQHHSMQIFFKMANSYF